jgi:hypothetical protein
VLKITNHIASSNIKNSTELTLLNKHDFRVNKNKNKIELNRREKFPFKCKKYSIILEVPAKYTESKDNDKI